MSQSSKNRITVDIYGVQYTIVGTESASHIRHVASIVDEKMREISSMNPSLDTNRLAVLTAINVVSDYLKVRDRLEQHEKEIIE